MGGPGPWSMGDAGRLGANMPRHGKHGLNRPRHDDRDVETLWCGAVGLRSSSSAKPTVNEEPLNIRVKSIYWSIDQWIFPPGSLEQIGSFKPTRKMFLSATSLKSNQQHSPQNPQHIPR